MSEQLISTTVNSDDTSTTPERPEWLPEKFTDAAALAAAYAELETKLGNTPPPPAAPVDPAAPLAIPKPAPVDPNAKLDFDKYQQEFVTNGVVSEASYAELAARGIDKTIVDTYIDGQLTKQANFVAEAHKVAGGAEEYAKALAWAGMNMTSQEIDSFNASLNGTTAQMKFAVAGLASMYKAASGTQATLLQGGAAPVVQGDKFTTQAEITAAMSDPRYETDPKYRESVYARM